jgi:vacuolar-type H+-ATPase subunit H
MPTMSSQKIAILENQRAALVAKLEVLQRDLDAAADAADTALISQLQSGINSVHPMIASCDRRLKKARAENTESERQARREANTARVETFASEVAEMRKSAPAVVDTVAKLAKQLEVVKAHGDKAREAVNELMHQIPFNERPHFWVSMLQNANMQPIMGAVLEDLMNKHGIFSTLAVNSGVSIRPHGFASVDEVFEARGENLKATVQKIAQSINEGI